jgi:hypothetical protein
VKVVNDVEILELMVPWIEEFYCAAKPDQLGTAVEQNALTAAGHLKRPGVCHEEHPTLVNRTRRFQDSLPSDNARSRHNVERVSPRTSGSAR